MVSPLEEGRFCQMKFWRLIGPIFVVLAGWSSWNCGRPPTAQIEGKADTKEKTIVFIIDPTIFDSEEKEKLEALLRDFRNFCTRGLKTDTKVVLFFVDTETVFSRPPVEEKLVGDVSTEWQRKQREEINRLADKLISEIRRKWQEVHAAPERPRTCIASTMARVREYARSRSTAIDEIWIVMVSDLLEVCGEWGKDINMEKDIRDISALREVLQREKVFFHFGSLRELVIIQVENEMIGSPLDNRTLRSGWLELFKAVGIEERVIRVATDFPRELESGGV